MTLFGQALDGQQLFAVVSMVTLLAVWLVVLRRQRAERKWLKRQDELDKVVGGAPRQPGDGPARGPWG